MRVLLERHIIRAQRFNDRGEHLRERHGLRVVGIEDVPSDVDVAFACFAVDGSEPVLELVVVMIAEIVRPGVAFTYLAVAADIGNAG